MIKMTSKSDLTRQEKMLNKWTGERRSKQEAKYKDKLPEDPDEQAIRRACLEIQKTWSPYQRRIREVTKPRSVELAEIPVSILLGP